MNDNINENMNENFDNNKDDTEKNVFLSKEKEIDDETEKNEFDNDIMNEKLSDKSKVMKNDFFKENDKEIKNKLKNNQINKENVRLFAIYAIAIAIAVGALFFIQYRIADAAKKASEKYESTKNETIQSIYNDYYDKSYEKAEKTHHVKNEVTINITSLKETSKLEVIKVNDIDYEIWDNEDESLIEKITPSKKVQSWLEVPGKAVYTVDLQASEIIVDNERRYVLLRIPRPEITEFTIDYENVNILELDGGDMQNVNMGADTAREQLKSAEQTIKHNISTNQRFYKSAEASSVTILTNLVKDLNADISDLTVEVEFMD